MIARGPGCPGPRYRNLQPPTVMVGTVASVLSRTIVNVELPGLKRLVSSGQERAQRVSASFMASFMAASMVAMLPTPWRKGAERAPQPR